MTILREASAVARKAHRNPRLLLAITGLLLASFVTVAGDGVEAAAPCRCRQPAVQPTGSIASGTWIYDNLEIPHLSKSYAKLDLFSDGLEGDRSCRWPCLESPAAGTYTLTLSTTSETSFFDVFVFLVPSDLSNRTTFAARSLGAEVAQGMVQLSFNVPDEVDPSEWILLFLFDEDLCYTLDYRECITSSRSTEQTIGTMTLTRH